MEKASRLQDPPNTIRLTFGAVDVAFSRHAQPHCECLDAFGSEPPAHREVLTEDPTVKGLPSSRGIKDRSVGAGRWASASAKRCSSPQHRTNERKFQKSLTKIEGAPPGRLPPIAWSVSAPPQNQAATQAYEPGSGARRDDDKTYVSRACGPLLDFLKSHCGHRRFFARDSISFPTSRTTP